MDWLCKHEWTLLFFLEMTSKGCASMRRSWGYIVTLVLEMTTGSEAHQGKHCRACTVPSLSSKFGPLMALRMSLVVPDPLVAACCGIVPLQAHSPCGWLQDHDGPLDPAHLSLWHCPGHSADPRVEQRPLFVCVIDTIRVLHSLFQNSCISFPQPLLHIDYHWETLKHTGWDPDMRPFKVVPVIKDQELLL